MAIIPIYVDSDAHIKFLEKDKDERTRIRKEAQTIILEEVYHSKKIKG